jgi:hypothetical protein
MEKKPYLTLPLKQGTIQISEMQDWSSDTMRVAYYEVEYFNEDISVTFHAYSLEDAVDTMRKWRRED